MGLRLQSQVLQRPEAQRSHGPSSAPAVWVIWAPCSGTTGRRGVTILVGALAPIIKVKQGFQDTRQQVEGLRRGVVPLDTSRSSQPRCDCEWRAQQHQPDGGQLSGAQTPWG